MRSVTSEPGETLDALLWRVLGSTAAVSIVLAANPGVASAGPILPTGTTISIPDAAETTIAPLREDIKLWD